MPLIFAFLLLEVIVFVAVGFWLGFGWAILIVLGLMLVGSLLASASLRRTLLAGQSASANPGAVAGDTGLIMAGWAMSIVPGIVSSVVGLILVFGPTRNLIRRALARKLTRSMEDFGVRVFQHSPMAQQHTSYGRFGSEDAESSQSDAPRGHEDNMVVEEEDIEKWARDLRPDDFREGK